MNIGAPWPVLDEVEPRVLAMQKKLHQWDGGFVRPNGRTRGEPDAVRVARPVRRAGRRNPPIERWEGRSGSTPTCATRRLGTVP